MSDRDKSTWVKMPGLNERRAKEVAAATDGSRSKLPSVCANIRRLCLATALCALAQASALAQGLHDRGASSPPAASEVPRAAAPTNRQTSTGPTRRWTSNAPYSTCDSFVGFQYDFESWKGNGHWDDLIPHSLAIPACREALQVYPSEARFAYMLGRALVAARRYSDARRMYQQIADAGYPPGMFEYGYLIKDIYFDARTGCDFVRRAGAAGFGRVSSTYVECMR